MYCFLTDTLKAGIAAGELRPDLDVPAAALALAGMMNFYFISRPISQNFVAGGTAQDAQYVVQAVEIFLNGVKRHDRQ